MKAVWRIILIILFCLMSSFPTVAQVEECLEIWEMWSDDTRHEVNLDTGTVTTYESPYASGSTSAYWHSPDRRYTYNLEPQGLGLQHLTLTDSATGDTILLSEIVSSRIYWSEDSQWLAYIEQIRQPDTINDFHLTVYNVETTQTASVQLHSGRMGVLNLAWSPDASQIAIAYTAYGAEDDTKLSVYSVPQLTLTHTFEAAWTSGTLVWSPSGRYLGVSRENEEATLIDTLTAEMYTLALEKLSTYQFAWSPNEHHVLIYFDSNIFYNEYNIMTTTGDIVLEDIFAKGAVWIDDDQMLFSVWMESGASELMLFNLQTGERHRILPNIGHYDVSPDNHYVATQRSNVRNSSENPRVIQFFDLTQSDNLPVFRLTLDTTYQNFIWRTNSLELIILFTDRSLRGYNFETREWRSIATIAGDERGMQLVPCSRS